MASADSSLGSATSRRRALVLGGGGATGNAWLVGVVAGLLEEGVDVTRADLVVGTSAGATAAAQVTSAPAAELLTAVLEAPVPQRPTQPAATRPVSDQMERTARLIAAATDPADMRRRLGAAALDLAAVSGESWAERWRATVATRLPSQAWPAQRVLVTAVDAATGEPVGFDRDSGVDLVDAVAASCSSGPAYRIGERAYIDGGYRANADNADLAAGFDEVLVLSPFGGRSRAPAAWGLDLAAQVAALRAGGSRVQTLVPATEYLGASAMDLSLRAPAARSGRGQGRELAPRIEETWG